MDFGHSMAGFNLVCVLITFVANVSQCIVYPIISRIQSKLQLHLSLMQFYTSTW